MSEVSLNEIWKVLAGNGQEVEEIGGIVDSVGIANHSRVVRVLPAENGDMSERHQAGYDG